MARLHSRKKGKSGSKKPASIKFAKNASKLSAEEVTTLVEKLAKEGKPPELVGQIMRDEHKTPSVKTVTGKTIIQLMAEKNIIQKYPSDLMNLIKRAMGVRTHLKTNKTDVHNRVKLGHIESKIKRLVRYYRGNKLPKDWKYDPEAAALLVK